MTYYLGIDGGGTKTTCAVGDETSLLATVVSGPSNITRVGERGARESLQQAIREACAAAGIEVRQIQRACIGAAGAGRAEVASAIRKIVEEIVPGEIEVVGDMPIALEAALGTGPGVIVVAGTGSFAYGRNRNGLTARAGGGVSLFPTKGQRTGLDSRRFVKLYTPRIGARRHRRSSNN